VRQSLPPELTEVLRPALPGVGEAIIDAISEEVPDYARPLTGTFGRQVHRGVEVALRRFVDEIDRPGSVTARRGREVYLELGRGEARAGRGLDALLAAYRVGARVAWRRLVDAATGGGLEPDVIYDLGEAVFAYIDEISAESVEGYTDEQSRVAGERERRRRALARLLAADPPAPAEQVRAEALAAAWRLPDSLGALVGGPEAARHLPHDALVLVDEDACLAFVPDPAGPGRRAELERAAPAALGPAVPWPQAARSLARARAAWSLQAAGVLDGEGLVVAGEHLDTLLLGAAPELAAELREQALAPLAGERASSREKLVATLRAYLDHPGQPQRIAQRLGVHPQTVRYRLRRLRELLGEDALEDPDRRFALALALRAP
jgi:DNA-binding transcriptional ArsR family regulator